MATVASSSCVSSWEMFCSAESLPPWPFSSTTRVKPCRRMDDTRSLRMALSDQSPHKPPMIVIVLEQVASSKRDQCATAATHTSPSCRSSCRQTACGARPAQPEASGPARSACRRSRRAQTRGARPRRPEDCRHSPGAPTTNGHRRLGLLAPPHDRNIAARKQQRRRRRLCVRRADGE